MSNTECSNIEPLPIAEEQGVQLYTNNDTIPMSIASPSESPVDLYSIVNNKLVKHEQDPELIHHGFIVTDNESTRTYSTVNYHSSSSNSTDWISLLNYKSKLNDNSDDQITGEKTNLPHIESEPSNNEQSDFTINSYNNISNIDYTHDVGLDYYIQNSGEFNMQNDTLFETINNDCLSETEPIFTTDDLGEVGANVEISSIEMSPID